MKIALSDGWLPADIGYRHGRGYVRVVRLGDKGLQAPFSEIDFHKHKTSTWIPLDKLLAMELPACGSPGGFIYHMSRTGSTVVGQMFRALDGVEVVSEPQAINNLFFRPGEIDEAELERHVRFILDWYLSVLGHQRTVVFKFSSWLTLHSDRLQAWYPSVPCCFMHREPVEVLYAIVNDPPFMFRRNEMRRKLLAPRPNQPNYGRMTTNALRASVDYLDDCDYVEFVARFLGVICEAAAKAYVEDRSILPIHYASFERQVLEDLAPAFGIRLADSERDRMLAATRDDVKQVFKSVAFGDDSRRKRKGATPLMHELCSQYIQPSIDILMDKG